MMRLMLETMTTRPSRRKAAAWGEERGENRGGETVFVSNSCSYEANDHFIC